MRGSSFHILSKLNPSFSEIFTYVGNIRNKFYLLNLLNYHLMFAKTLS